MDAAKPVDAAEPVDVAEVAEVATASWRSGRFRQIVIAGNTTLRHASEYIVQVARNVTLCRSCVSRRQEVHSKTQAIAAAASNTTSFY